jgi:ligand-binding sensor domain-containing protein/signal transduction histidine kinase
MQQLRRLFLLLLLLNWPLRSADPGHCPSISFDCLTLEQGLSQSTVTAIAQDAAGYLWFGTIDGLNKFDGYDFTVYRNDSDDTNSIAGGWITALCLARDGTLWIGTLASGLCRYDSRTGHFSNYGLETHPVDSPERQRLIAALPFTFSYLNHYTIKAICEDPSGVLWIGTFGSGLYQFDPKCQSFVHYPFDFIQPNDLAYNIMSLCATRENGHSTLWIGTYGGGLIQWVSGEGFSIYQHDAANPNSLSDNRVMVVYPDSLADCLWVGTLGGGLNQFHLATGDFTHFQHDPDNANSLSSDQVLSIQRDCCDGLWIGTFDAGLNQLEIGNHRFTRYQHDPRDINSLGSNEILSLFEDRSDVLWIGTNFGYGINKLNRRKHSFVHYFHDHSQPNSLSENVIFSLCEDRAGVLWIGTFQSGLDRLDRVNHQFTHYPHQPANPNSLSDNHVRTIFEDRQGQLWIGTFSGGLNYFDRRKNRFVHFQHDPSNPKSLSHNQVRSIHEDESGNLWIATFGGLNRFDRKTRSFTRYRHDPANPNSLSQDQVYYITGDGRGTLWIATFGGGVDRLDIVTEQFVHYRHDPNDPNSLCDDRILTIYVDEQDTNLVWFGSFGSGCDRFDQRNQRFTHFTQRNGLPNDVVYCLLPDDSGNLWLSTNKGISKFNVGRESFVNYDLSDGLQSNEFNAGAYSKSQRTGELFMGGVNGFNCFFPGQIQTNRRVPAVVITSFKIFDEETAGRIGAVFPGKEIHLSHKENFFSFQFSVLDFTDVSKNQFAYKLEGLDENWTYCGTRRYVNYTNLDPGKYIFRVKGANCDGMWNEAGTMVQLNIQPKFTQRWYWHPLVVGTLVLLIILFFTLRTRARIRRALELEAVRLEEKEQVQMTIAADFHDELGQKLTRISLLSEILKTRLARGSPEDMDYINKINRAAKELASSTRDFIWALNPLQDSLYDVAIYLKDFGDEMFDKTDIQFRVSGISKELEGIKLPLEWRRHLILIFKEAMNNALKHACCENVTFRIELNQRKLAVALSDDGIGCSNGKNSPGQGLKNMKQRAKAIPGAINIYSVNGKGTTIEFTAEIP